MSAIDLKNCIISTQINQSNIVYKDVNFQTKDKIFIGEFSDYIDNNEYALNFYSTDYAILCGACYDFMAQTHIEEKIYNNDRPKVSIIITRSQCAKNENVLDLVEVGENNPTTVFLPDTPNCCVVPMMNFDMSQLYNTDYSKLGIDIKILPYNSGATISIGEFPQTCASKMLNKKLEFLYQLKNLTKTGKTYTGAYDDTKRLFVQNEEFLYEGQKYVRVKDNSYISTYARYTTNNSNEEKYFWVKVEPIEWLILNWNEVKQKCVNYEMQTLIKNNVQLKLVTQKGIIGGMFFCPFENNKNYHMLWQNSTIRNYLNGYNSGECILNVNKNFLLDNGDKFKGKHNFLSEAFNCYELVETENDLQSKLKEMRDKLVCGAFKRKKQQMQNSEEAENIN